MCFSRATMGSQGTNLVKSLSPGVRPSSRFIIRKQGAPPQYKPCFYTLWLLNYLLIKNFITRTLSTTLTVVIKNTENPSGMSLKTTRAAPTFFFFFKSMFILLFWVSLSTLLGFSRQTQHIDPRVGISGTLALPIFNFQFDILLNSTSCLRQHIWVFHIFKMQLTQLLMCLCLYRQPQKIFFL